MTTPPNVSASLTVTPSSPNHGDTVTAFYSVTGNDPVPPHGASISGQVVVGGQEFDVSTSFTLPGSPAADVTYGVPSCPGLTFAATDDPATFTAVVP
jgi:hypothetical protein